MVSNADIYAKATEAKRRFPRLDALVPDAALRRGLSADPSAGDGAGPLTLARCLVHCHYPDPFPPQPTLAAIEKNLDALWDKIDKPGQLRQKLLNPDQFLNTISELALARSLRDNGYEVTLEYKFAQGRDADILAVKHGRQYHVDVTNLAARPLPMHGVVSGTVSEVGEMDLVVKKIAAKFREKFEGPLDRGWPGHAWIALDVAKNDRQNVDVVLQRFTRPNWIREVKVLMHRECPTLEGCVIYRSDPTAIHVDVVGWVECAI